MKETQELLSIGELAKLYNIPESTLRYYDDIDLFKPAIVKDHNHYRYYTPIQFQTLDMIQYMKYMGISLKEIKQHLAKPDIENLRAIFLHYKEVNKKKLEEVTFKQHLFNQHTLSMNVTWATTNFGTVTIKTLAERRILLTKTTSGTPSDVKLKLKFLEKEANLKPTIFFEHIGFVKTQENLVKRNLSTYDAVAILLNQSITTPHYVHTLPFGDYACIYCRNSLFETTKNYEILLDYIESNGYRANGHSFEQIFIDEFITDDPKKHLTQIQLPVRKIEKMF